MKHYSVAKYITPMITSVCITIISIHLACAQELAKTAQITEIEAIVTDRPDYTESVETVPAGKIQIEGGYTYTQSDRHSASQSFGEALIRVSSGRNSELRIGLNSYDVNHGPEGSNHGLEDADIGVKIRLTEGKQYTGLRHPAVSVIALTSLPTGTGSERGRDLQPTVKLCLGFDLTQRLGLGVNANYSYISDDTGHYSQFNPSASFGYTLTDRVGSYFEYYGFYPEGQRPKTHYFDTGLTYLINNDTQLDVRIGAGLNGASDDFFIGTGGAVRF